MASTNKTTTLELSQFVGTDVPGWLTDYNSDMSKIDAFASGVNSNVSGAVQTANSANTTAQSASTAANQATSAATTANNTVNSILTGWKQGNLSGTTATVKATYNKKLGLCRLYGSIAVDAGKAIASGTVLGNMPADFLANGMYGFNAVIKKQGMNETGRISCTIDNNVLKVGEGTASTGWDGIYFDVMIPIVNGGGDWPSAN